MQKRKTNMTGQKGSGRIYTPDFIVGNILDLCSYSGRHILKKHVIDNSCGDGAFLCEIVRRYCEAACSEQKTVREMTQDLEKYVHGIEIDAAELEKCRCRLSAAARAFGAEHVNWNLVCADALHTHDFDGQMDFVLGNPPYVRVHNLGGAFDDVKRFRFAQSGMTDFYIAFYEIGIRMLSPHGTLGYITPSSFYNSLAGSTMRKVLAEENLLDQIVDLKHFQAFSSTTYTTIAVLKKHRDSRTTDYYGYDEKKHKPYYIDTLTPDDYYIQGHYYFAKKDDLSLLHQIICHTGTSDITVKNGYATLCDKAFVHDFDFDSPLIIPVVKSSKGITQKIFFPYDQAGKLLPETVIQQDERLYRYLLDHKAELTDRSSEKDSSLYWYAFGRSQAIGDTFRNKLAINTVLRDERDLKFTAAPAGVGVYGGLYIVSDSVPVSQIEDALRTSEFAAYIALLGKYKSGGYYTFSSKDLKKYLDYQFQ